MPIYLKELDKSIMLMNITIINIVLSAFMKIGLVPKYFQTVTTYGTHHTDTVNKL